MFSNLAAGSSTLAQSHQEYFITTLKIGREHSTIAHQWARPGRYQSNQFFDALRRAYFPGKYMAPTKTKRGDLITITGE